MRPAADESDGKPFAYVGVRLEALHLLRNFAARRAMLNRA